MSDVPQGLDDAGARLWTAVHEHLELDAHEDAMLLEACRTVDQLDRLNEAVTDDGTMVDGKPHPALVEARQQRIVLSRLIASLRLPEDLAAPEVRPQRRGAARRPYGLRAVK